MKRKLALLTAVLLLVTLFAGCGGGSTTTPTAAPATQAPATAAPATPSGGNATPAPATPEPTEDPGPYNLAAGKYAVNEKGVPLSKYDYELPLTTSDETFTYWRSVMMPDQIDVDHYEDMPYPAFLRERTGVHIQYMIIASASRKENFAAMLASDDLPDLVSGYRSYYPGTMQNSIDDGYSINLYDYKEYIPNYWYTIWSHEDDVTFRGKMMVDDHTITEFKNLNDIHINSYGAACRGDWLDKIGKKVDDIVTLDDFHNMALAFQSQIGCEHPLALYQTLDAHLYMSCFDTISQVGGSSSAPIAPMYVRDGKVTIANSTDADKNYMTNLNGWYNEGLIIPNWINFNGNAYFAADFQTDLIGITSMQPSGAPALVDKESQPDAYWTPLHEPVLYEGQVFHLGDWASWIGGFGSWVISTKCENVPLLATYCDWYYSDQGIFDTNWGPEGYGFEYDENGEPQLTDFIVNNPGGMAFAVVTFMLSDIHEAGVLLRIRSFSYPEGRPMWSWFDVWNGSFYHYDGAWVWPDCFTIDDEDRSYINSVATDLSTFISENYLKFVDNSAPMSEWDNYVNTLTHLDGWNECLAIWQSYYDDWAATR